MDKSLIETCIQCGKCSASCSFSKYMEYSPRKLINIFLSENKIPENINAFWLCTSCYTCTIKCPRGIPLIDFIYLIRENYYDKLKNKYAEFYKVFHRNIKKNKRLKEKSAFLEYFINSPLFLIQKIDLLFKLLIKKRL